MTKKNLSILQKIADLENKTKSLFEVRNNELLAIIKHTNAITIDNSLLAGFLIFALDKTNQNHPIMQEFLDIAKTNKIPSSKGKKSNITTAT